MYCHHQRADKEYDKTSIHTEVQQSWPFAQGFLLPQALHQHHLQPTPEVLHTILRTPLHPQAVMSVQRPAHQAKREHHDQVDQFATNNIAVDFSRRFHSFLPYECGAFPSAMSTGTSS